MSPTLLVVFIGSVLGAAALAVYSFAMLRKSQLRQPVRVLTSSPPPRASAAQPTAPPVLPGLPPVAISTWGSRPLIPAASTTTVTRPARIARGSIVPVLDPGPFDHGLDDEPTHNVVIGPTRRPVSGT